MSAEKVLNDLRVKLYEKIDDVNLLERILIDIGETLKDYEITEKTTELVVVDDVPQCMKVFIVTKKIEGRSEGTIALYKTALDDIFHVLRKPLTEITANDIRLYLFDLKERTGMKDITLDSRRKIIHSFFTWAHNEGYISRNPSLQIAPIKFEKVPREPFSDIEMEMLREACVCDRDKAIIETFYSTGCRVSELINIKMSDIDFREREVKLFGKGKKHRTSYINARAEVALKNYLASREGESEYVFITNRKPYKHITKATAEQIVKKIGKRAGIDNVFPHRIRHTTATDALDHGMPVSEVQSILGHEKLDTTMIYAKVRQTNVAHDHRKCIL